MELAEHHSLEDIRNIVASGEKVSLSSSAIAKIEKCHAYFLDKVA